MFYIFKNIFKKFFILFFILRIFLHIIYVKEMKDVSRIRRRTPFFYTFFLYMSSRRLQPCRHSARGCGCLIFCGEKRKKEKERKRKKWRVSVSKKKRYFSRFKFVFLDCHSLKCDFGKARLPKIFTRNFRQEVCLFYYWQVITQRPQKVHTFMRHLAAAIKKCTH